MNGFLLGVIVPMTGNGRGRDDRPMGGRWDMHDGGVGWAGWLLMLLLVLLLVAVVVGVVLLLVRGGSGGARAGSGQTGVAGEGTGAPPGAAEHVLDERYARGEIDEQEYLHRRSVLRGE